MNMADVEPVVSQSFIIPAVISAIAVGSAALLTALPPLIKAFRQDYGEEADRVRGILRRVYYTLRHDPAWGTLEDDLKEAVKKEAES